MLRIAVLLDTEFNLSSQSLNGTQLSSNGLAAYDLFKDTQKPVLTHLPLPSLYSKQGIEKTFFPSILSLLCFLYAGAVIVI